MDLTECRNKLRTALTAKAQLIHTQSLDLEPFVLYSEEKWKFLLQELCAKDLLPKACTLAHFYELLLNALAKGSQSSMHDLSVDSLAESLAVSVGNASSGGSLDLSDASYKEVRQQLATAMLGWLTLLFDWCPTNETNRCSIRGASEVLTIPLEECDRPTGSFIRYHGVLPPPYSNNPNADEMLYLSILNFHCLTHIGRLRVEWTPLLSRHLLLNTTEMTLQIFCFPSVCLLALAQGEYDTFCQRYVSDLS
jgi:hypothetical protein